MSSSSSSLQAARQRLGDKLRGLRLAAGMSGRAFAAAAGCQASKISQIEKAVRPASVADVRLWCRICGASPQQEEELLAEQAAVARLWIAFRDLGRRTGLNATQKLLSGDMWERVRLFRAYQTKVIPGLLQAESYMSAILTGVRRERGVEVDDVAEAVAERIGRQGYLLQRDRQFVFVVEELVLRFRPYGTAIQREQLTHLLDATRLPSVTLAVIPMAADRHGLRPRESFDITDSSLVTIELLSGFLSLTHPDEIASYVTAWEQLLSIAVRGKAARSLIADALSAIDDIMGPGEADS
ncbi:MAG TPA: helix-turn-helix transcriptional regulator [Streptosporangiaceae bacterium]|nr:helix-turn-helix transcriptional regulator [Streptosporangiaceae bacterium]